MKVEIWSDVACPWCYVGLRRFESALETFPHADEVEVEWKSFELDPGTVSGAPRVEGVAPAAVDDYAARLGRKFGSGRDGAVKMLDSMTATAASVGLDFHFESAIPANTFQAHQVVHLGAAHGLQHEVKERFLRAHFSEGEALGDVETLVRLGASVGLDVDEIRAALADERYAADVRADEAEAATLGISGVPFFVLDRRFGVSGAQPPEAFRQALDQAWAESHPLTMVAAADPSADGEVCGPDGCAV